MLLRGYGSRSPPDWSRIDVTLTTMRTKFGITPTASEQRVWTAWCGPHGIVMMLRGLCLQPEGGLLCGEDCVAEMELRGAGNMRGPACLEPSPCSPACSLLQPVARGVQSD